VIELAKHYFRQTSLYDFFLVYRQRKDLKRWLASGKTGETPHLVKKDIILQYSHRYQISIFIETGTFIGEMVIAVRDHFEKIISIELSKELSQRATKKFADARHIQIINGDSAKILDQVLPSVTGKKLFWLDAHYSGGFSAKGTVFTPIQQELCTIFKYSSGKDVILIDDARLFTGQNDYPTLDTIKHLVLTNLPLCAYRVEDDIIRIFPQTHAESDIL
jgi:hypothetical protein